MLNILVGNKYIWYKLKRINLIYSNYYNIAIKKSQLHKIQKTFHIPYECTKTLILCKYITYGRYLIAIWLFTIWQNASK